MENGRRSREAGVDQGKDRWIEVRRLAHPFIRTQQRHSDDPLREEKGHDRSGQRQTPPARPLKAARDGGPHPLPRRRRQRKQAKARARDLERAAGLGRHGLALRALDRGHGGYYSAFRSGAEMFRQFQALRLIIR